MLLAVSGKILALLAREIVPFVLSLLVRDGMKKLAKKKKEKDLPQPSEDVVPSEDLRVTKS